MKDYIVTVMARDRVGIVRDTSAGLAGIDGNITHVSQTVMRGYFTLIMSVQVPDDRMPSEIRQAVERQGDVGELEVNVRPFIEPAPEEHVPSTRYVLSIQGKDQPGIISSITNYLADRGVNIDDFYAYVADERFVMLVQLSIPLSVNLEEVQTGLEKVGHQFDMAVSLQHENIFRATSEVKPVISLGE